MVFTLALLLIVASTTTIFVDAWIASTNTAARRISLPTTTTTALKMSAVNETIAKPSSSASLPDFGSTTIEVDKIKLEKKRRKKKADGYDTKVGMDKKEQEQKENKWRRSDLFGSSLVDQTMDELRNDKDFQSTQKRIEKVGLAGMSKEERTQRRRALDKLNVQPFAKFLTEQMNGQAKSSGEDSSAAATTTKLDDGSDSSSAVVAPKPKRVKPYILKRKAPTILQINIGLYCNQACGHCHVESSPLRKTEMMTAETAAQCLELLKNTPSIDTLDITGGAPELNAHFRYLVSMARAIRGKDLTIIDRCNLTVLQEPGQEDLVEFLKDQDVHVIASLPCYSAENVDTQRGGGVFERSIAALLALNEAGYGRKREELDHGPRLQLDLVYNPLGAFLPPPQEKLQVQYQEQLAENFGILFDQLYTITNMPIKRFADFLHRRGELAEYMDLLVRNFNPDTVEELMCLNTINIGWDGKVRLYSSQILHCIPTNRKLGPIVSKRFCIRSFQRLVQFPHASFCA
jgi:radical SAM/Cys-rich protein